MRRHFLLIALVLLAGCGDKPPQGGSSGGTKATKQRHANEIASPDDMPTKAWRRDPPGTTPERGDTAVLTLLSDIDGFNPFTSQSVEASEVQELLYPRLLVEEPDYYAGPPTFTENIAFVPKAGEDQRSLRYTLRDCTWSDGTPLTSEDVRFSWLAARDAKVAWVSRSIVDYITDIEVTSPREFTVRFAEVYPYQVMDINDVHIIPKHVFGKVPFEQWQGRSWNQEAKVSGGPWLLEKYTPNTEISFVPNPTYWDTGKPYLSRAVFKIQGSMETNLVALLSGDVDFMLSVTPKDARRVLEDGDLLLYSYQSRTIGWIGWNTKKPPFDDVRVRRAMTMAIDRENIVESVLYGYGKVAGPVVITSMWASNPDIKPVEFDPAAAEKLLDEVGWLKGGDGFRSKGGTPLAFALVTNAGNDVRKKICEYVQASLRDVGAKVELKLQDFNQMSQQLKRHSFDAYVGGMSVATKVDGKPIFHSTAAQGSYNYPDFAHPRVDEIIDQARIMTDQAKARPLWAEMQKIMDEAQVYTTIYEPRGLVGLSRRFRNVQVTALRALTNLHEWWVPKAEQRFK